MSWAPLVHVVDDDLEIRESLRLLLRSVAIEAKTYASADEFFADFAEDPGRPAVLLLDVRMPGMSGMALLESLRAEQVVLPVIMITGHGDIDMAVQAMKLGARDFIVKPFSPQTLLDRIQEVLRQVAATATPVSADEAAALLATLTRREREIFWLLISGATSKAIALDLGLSSRTVEAHRAHIMQKMKAKSVVDLVMLSVALKQAWPGRA